MGLGTWDTLGVMRLLLHKTSQASKLYVPEEVVPGQT